MVRSAKTHRITAPSRTALLRRRRSSPVPGSAVYIIDTPGARPRNRKPPEKGPKRRIPFRWTDFLVFHGRSSTSINRPQCETPTTNAAEGKITERRYSQISPSEMTLTSAKHQKYRVDRVLSTHTCFRITTRTIPNEHLMSLLFSLPSVFWCGFLSRALEQGIRWPNPFAILA